MAVYKCLGCRGLANAGLLPRAHKWEWRAVTLQGEALHHLVRLVWPVRWIAFVGMAWKAETACGEEFIEEVPGEGE